MPEKALKLLSRNLKILHNFPYTPDELHKLFVQIADKLSIQGVQPKLSTRLNIKNGMFEVVEKEGTFIFKPPNPLFRELPANEDLTMRLASSVGIEIPLHGMIYNKDLSLTYFIKRFDRYGKGKKLAVEDFSQLSDHSRRTKYESSMEKVAQIIDTNCTFPIPEKIKLFKLTLFNFLVGNEDMHLKNFSLITRNEVVELSPAYDLLNTTIVTNSKEEIALPIRGKKSRLKHEDLFQYYAYEYLRLSRETINEVYNQMKAKFPLWETLIKNSFLSTPMQNQYLNILRERISRFV